MQMVIKLRRKIKIDDKFAKIVKTRLAYSRKKLLNREDLNEEKFEQELVDSILKYAIVEFDSHQIFYYFKEDKNGKPRQVFVDKIKTTCEVDLGDYE